MSRRSCGSCGRHIEASSSDDATPQGFCSKRCFDLAQVREAFDSKLIEIVMLSRPGGDGERALEILDGLRNAWLDSDHDGWLDRTIRSHRAIVYQNAGRHQDALDELRIVESSLPPLSDELVLTKASIVRGLEGAGRYDEALEELTSLIAAWEQLPILRIMGILGMYVDITAAAGKVVDVICSEVLLQWSARTGIHLSSELVETDLPAAIRDATDRQQKGEKRFSQLCRFLESQTEEERTDTIRQYIASEPIIYLQQRASRLLALDDEE
ncbi:hypothetical protein [Chondromyces crocatus]|uniref:Tetratricopeptide repeat protein n=1 Tax=Chondromyces crocatus TaxID=52 RepID=A0A0K1EES7_CHOCO|nr:hypothetical protein [Chondromyces crocatus]AKT39192.1 uncharacterized protein CMC5_033410 [Chondromyces crocatus]